MLNEEQEQKIPLTLSLWQRGNSFLFEPHIEITDVGSRRQARLISIIVFLTALAGLAGSLSVVFVVGVSRGLLVLTMLTLVSIIGYALTRTRMYKIGGYTIVWALAFASFGVGSAENLSRSLYSNLILAFVIASIIFPFRYMTFFASVNLLAIGFMPLIYAGYENVGTDLGIFIPFSLLILAALRFRDNLEIDRLAELQQINQDLTTLSNELEQRVDIRTAELEESSMQSNKRASQLEAIAEVASSVASIQDIGKLLPYITQLVSHRFGFYHTGIFLLSEDKKFAVLQAANSEGGQKMLARKHQLRVGLEGIVGFSIEQKTARIALDVGEDAVYFNNPDLPTTRSEMALPLMIGNDVIGVIDVQSEEPNAFKNEDIEVLSTLANQVAVAIENARLFQKSQEALQELDKTFQKYIRSEWRQFATQSPIVGYRAHETGLEPITKERTVDDQSIDGNGNLHKLPIKLRGATLGSIEINMGGGKQIYTEEEVNLIQTVADRLALALESARLLNESQRAAAKEQVIGEIIGKIGSSINLRNVLQTAVEELGRSIPGSEIVIQLQSEKSQSQEGTA